MDTLPAFHALTDANRRFILETLARGPLSVAELATHLPISRPAVSQHLQVLQQASLVSWRKEGTRSIYSVDPQGLTVLREYLDGLWSLALGDFKAAAESRYQTSKKREKK